MEYISYEEFKKMDIRVGTIKEVEAVPDTDKLLRCQIDFGLKPVETGSAENERDVRQIISGIKEYYPDPSVLVGKQVLYILNLEPRKIKGYESNGMLMAVDGPLDLLGVSKPVFLVPETEVESGCKVR